MKTHLLVGVIGLVVAVNGACAQPKATFTASASPTVIPTPLHTSPPTQTETAEHPLLTPDEEACLIEAMGERASREVYTGQRQPSSGELDAIAGCGIGGPNLVFGSELPNFDMLPEASAQRNSALSPGPTMSKKSQLCSGDYLQRSLDTGSERGSTKVAPAASTSHTEMIHQRVILCCGLPS